MSINRIYRYTRVKTKEKQFKKYSLNIIYLQNKTVELKIENSQKKQNIILYTH